VLSKMRSKGILAHVNYMPAYWHPVFQKLGYKRGTCPESELFYNSEISIPFHTLLDDDTLRNICEIVESCISS